MVTMKQIDDLRGRVATIQKRIHECWERYGPKVEPCEACALAREHIEKLLRPEIEALLQLWWLQGCVEAARAAPFHCTRPGCAAFRPHKVIVPCGTKTEPGCCTRFYGLVHYAREACFKDGGK